MKERSATMEMGTERAKPIVASDEKAIGEPAQPIDEGVAVFRGLIVTALLYAFIGVIAWFAWLAWAHWFPHH